ncbi:MULTISPECIES: DUF4328 domain-containing protein [unclassified Streptomyces]|uniref:DUF4328 domain-containing protein n=1 Tax=unclassified Streptomyces TaxID=2593676 RepID=UPI002256BCCE|nr:MULTISPECIES: DUF4328 domain-containing protein [unclassified Streptomyces]WSP54916.1 DUF4328 domain-containing protein [Streptomyces sp. NBC_01241]WSU24344.1 DUF4328 domain-containing protein [Streptomyces sp. NBC_01108]MCX4786583.1 DUF4328 domain-containing protein [Streptomyces sp. NBC_01221]MCX4797651.1 DUF4328 domain-containing protein [Streptomyces sp. NBC_01242]WSJ38942.1 DUF4328 domain-containing protein [Streptomyces sp. NBC_01321]
MNTNATHAVAPAPAYFAVLRSPVGLGLATSLLLVAVIVADVLSLVSGGYLYGLLRGAADPGAAVLSVPGIEKRQLVYNLFGLLQSLLYITTGIVYLCWLYRLRDNAEVFAPGTHRRHRSWTAWGWLLPVVNLWFPRRITLDIWNASRPEGPYAPDRPGRGPINLWWGFWLVQGFVALVGGAVYDMTQSVGTANVGLGLLMLADLLDIACAVLAIRLVRTLTHMQHVKGMHGPVARSGEPVG